MAIEKRFTMAIPGQAEIRVVFGAQIRIMPMNSEIVTQFNLGGLK